MIKRKKNRGISSPSKTAKRDRRWTVLLIDSQGKTHTFYRLLETILIAGVLITVMVSTIGALVYINHRSASQRIVMKQHIDNLGEAIDTLKNEKEILMARLVVAESRVEENYTAQTPAADAAETRPQKKTAPQTEVKDKPAPIVEKVAAENVNIVHNPNDGSLNVNYRVYNKGSKDRPVAGRTVIVLKTDDQSPKNWLVLPRVPLQSNKPTGKYGKSFSIFNFRTMRFKANFKEDPYQFKTVVVYVYSMSGDLLLEKGFPIGPEARIVQIAPKPPPPQPSVSEKPAQPSTESPSTPPPVTPSSPAADSSAETAAPQKPRQRNAADDHQADDATAPSSTAKPLPAEQLQTGQPPEPTTVAPTPDDQNASQTQSDDSNSPPTSPEG